MSEEEATDRDRPDDGLANLGEGDLADAIVRTIDQPLVILDAELTVREVNPAFRALFRVDRAETVGRSLYALGNRQWDIPELRRLLGEVIPANRVVQGFRLEHAFPAIGWRVMSLNARALPATKERPELVLLAISDRTETERARLELEGHREFQHKLIDSLREYLVVLDWDLKVVRANQPFYDAFAVDRSDTEGRSLFDLGNGQWDILELRRQLEKVLPEDEAFDDVEVEHEFERIGRRVMLLNGRRLDHMELVLLAIRDVTELRRLEAQQKMLVGELHHRIGNLLTTVNALVSRTLRESGDLDAFKRAFATRIDALARTQKLLMHAPEEGVDLTELLRLELDAHGAREGESFTLAGPPARLSPKATKALALAIHELTTNAVKHGALGAQDGRIELRWDVRQEPGETRIRFSWRERRAAIDTETARRGFGSRILSNVFEQSLAGSSDWTLHPDGAELTAEFRANG